RGQGTAGRGRGMGARAGLHGAGLRRTARQPRQPRGTRGARVRGGGARSALPQAPMMRADDARDTEAAASAADARDPPTVWTIGHSTRSGAELVHVLNAFDIELLVDVRRFPGSRRYPQFARETLARTLLSADIEHRWIETLGGRRRPDADSPNRAWHHPAFRAYADYLAADEFAPGLAGLLGLAYGLRTVVMCSELLWWRRRRRLIADVLVWLGIPAVHIRDASAAEPHRLRAPARGVAGRLSYRA